MELTLNLLRLFHVMFGILWVGVALTLVLAVGPASLGLGLPERKAFQLQFLPRQMRFGATGAVVTLLTGLLLLWIVYASGEGIGFAHDRGYWIMLGSALGIGAWLIAMVVIVPTGKKILAILQGQGDPSQMPALGAKMGKIGPVVLGHMLTGTVCMLVAGHGTLPFNALNLVLVLGSGLGFVLAMIALSRKIKA